ncbi:MAG: TRAP transporter large permease subunit [Chloroflexota bacterium]|nr:TRAP transporter large permease subunit [Chloroflexota bacterium]
MEWYWALALIFGGFFFLFALGMPVAFCFILVSVIGSFWLGGEMGLRQIAYNIFTSITTFSFVPVPMFLLMGEIMFQSGIAPNMLDAVDKCMGRMPGRLALVAIAGGTALSFLTGVTVASIAILGRNLVPEMQRRGYSKSMSIGPILGSGPLAMFIPPSAQAILLGVIGAISIGALLIALVIPGLVIAAIMGAYVIIRCWLQPNQAPSYDVTGVTLRIKLMAVVRYILPLILVIFMVLGVILLGITTPSEGAATGVLGVILLAAIYGKLNWKVMKASFFSATESSIFILMIILAATSYSQMLAFSGASGGLVEWVLSLPVSPWIVLINIQILLLILGCFMPPSAIMLITLPLLMPVAIKLGFNPVWFGVIYLLNMEIGQITPPYGVGLFMMKQVAPPGTTMGDIIRAAVPFIICDLITMVILMAFPQISLWLPSMMRMGG